MAAQGGRRPRLVMVASPLQGHMTPMLQLATYLHSQGFSITIAHSDLNPPESTNHPDFTFLCLSGNLSGTGSSGSFIQFFRNLNDNCKPHLHEHLVQIINAEKVSSDKESIVIINDNLTFLPVKLPAIWVCRVSSCVAAVLSSSLRSTSSLSSIKKTDFLHKEIIPELHPFKYKDLPFTNHPIDQTLQLITMITPNKPPSAYLWNTIEFLEQPALAQIRDTYKVPVFTIGPLHKIVTTRSTSFLEEDTSCISWLDKQAPKSVVYVSLGSLANLDEKVASEMAWGLAMSNHPFLWVVRPGSVHGFEWVEFLPDGLLAELKARGLIVKWAPQKLVLAHDAVGGFWSHCGWNSTMEGVSEGVPMLCQPFDVDQLLNARYVSDVWKTGFGIVVERGEIAGAIKRVLVDEEGEEMRQRAMKIQEQVKLAISDGGSSYRSLNDLVAFISSL